MPGYHGSDPQILKEHWHCEKFGIPARDYQAFRSQRHNARARGIEFKFDLLQWRSWWRIQFKLLGVPGAQRGNKRGQYMMCRIGDKGAYEVGNVYLGTAKQNAADIDPKNRSQKLKEWHFANDCWLKGRKGDDHPVSIAVITPLGRFGSIALAAKAHGFSRQAGHYALKRGAWTKELV